MGMQFLNSVLSPGWQIAVTEIAIGGGCLYAMVLGFVLIMGRRHNRDASR